MTMTGTQYNSNNSLTPEFKWASFEKRNNLDDHILNIKTGTIQNPRQNSQLIHDPLCFQNPWICKIYRKNPHALFKAKTVDPKTYSPSSLIQYIHHFKPWNFFKEICNLEYWF